MNASWRTRGGVKQADVARDTSSRLATSRTEASRFARWLDGVGVGGFVTIFLIASAWSLASLWQMGWSWSVALTTVVMMLIFSAVGARYRSRRRVVSRATRE